MSDINEEVLERLFKENPELRVQYQDVYKGKDNRRAPRIQDRQFFTKLDAELKLVYKDGETLPNSALSKDALRDMIHTRNRLIASLREAYDYLNFGNVGRTKDILRAALNEHGEDQPKYKT